MRRLMRMLGRACTHLDQINDVEPSAQGCEECLRMGDTWVHLRECLICGHVGCCDSSVSLRIRNGILFRAALSPAGAASYALSACR
jgi:hypothetical protein